MSAQIIIRGGTVIDGTGQDPIPNGVVIVKGERIVHVGSLGSAPVWPTDNRQTTIIDATGQYVIPGLINAHEHLATHRGLNSFQARAAQPTTWILLRAMRNAVISLAMGVTTVRDMGSKGGISLVIRDAINAGQLLGPRVYACGQAITMTGGHGWQNGVEADGVGQVRAVARAMLKRGADFLKVMASGGFITQHGDAPWAPQLTGPEIAAVADEAHRAGKRVAAHCHPAQGIKVAIAAGVDTIEHGGLMDRESADLMARHGTYLIPTLDESWMIAERGHELGRPQWLIDACKAKTEHQLEVFALAVEAGVKLGVGTDVAGEMGRELKHMIDGGLKPMQALVAATRNGAEILDILDQVGTLTAGKLADLVILDENPLENPLICDEPHLVMKGGVIYQPSQLRAALGPTPN